MAASPPQAFPPINFRTRFPALDGVRALAISLVFIEHYGGGAHGGVLLHALNAIRERGWAGVDIFFVLSGFLITGILYDTLGDSHFLSRFFARRSLRILPLYYGVFLLFLLLTPILHFQWHPAHLWWLVYLGNVAGNWNFYNYFLISTNHFHFSANLAHFWSLCVEEQFYLLWPWIVFLVRDRKRLILTAAALSVLALVARWLFFLHAGPATAELWIIRSLPFRMDSLLIGGILALLLRGPNADRIQRACKGLFLLAMLPLLAIFVWSPSVQSAWLLIPGLSLTALASAGLIGMALRPATTLSRCFNLRPLRVLGKYSYGFYVFHNLFFYAWLQLLIRLIARTHSIALAGILEIGAAFVTSFLAAKLSFDLFESRFLRYKRHFEYDSERTTHQHAFTTD